MKHVKIQTNKKKMKLVMAGMVWYGTGMTLQTLIKQNSYFSCDKCEY